MNRGGSWKRVCVSECALITLEDEDVHAWLAVSFGNGNVYSRWKMWVT